MNAYYNARRMLIIAQEAYPTVEFRHVIGPKPPATTDVIGELMFHAQKWFNWVPIEHTEHGVKSLLKKGRDEADEVMDKNESIDMIVA
jgi:hypothetical protein